MMVEVVVVVVGSGGMQGRTHSILNLPAELLGRWERAAEPDLRHALKGWLGQGDL